MSGHCLISFTKSSGATRYIVVQQINPLLYILNECAPGMHRYQAIAFGRVLVFDLFVYFFRHCLGCSFRPKTEIPSYNGFAITPHYFAFPTAIIIGIGIIKNRIYITTLGYRPRVFGSVVANNVYNMQVWLFLKICSLNRRYLVICGTIRDKNNPDPKVRL